MADTVVLQEPSGVAISSVAVEGFVREELDVLVVRTERLETVLATAPDDQVVVERKPDTTVIERDQVIYIIGCGAQGPQGPPGTAGEQIDTVLAATMTAVADRLDGDFFRSAKWVITATGPAGARASEVLAVRTLAGISYSHFGIIGDAVRYTVDVRLVAGYIELVVGNTTASQMKISVVRIATRVF